MTKMDRLTIAIKPEMLESILKMRQRDEFRRYSISEIVRYLLSQAIDDTQTTT